MHFTPVATYIYIVKDGTLNFHSDFYSFKDEFGNRMIIRGNTLHVFGDEFNIDKQIEELGLNNSNIPILTKKVTSF